MSVSNNEIRGVIFDISGTVLDYGSRAPVVAFVELFARHGVQITEEDARRPMGSHKIDHIRTLLADARIGGDWQKHDAGLPVERGLVDLYKEFTAIQLEIIPRHCDVIPGVLEVTAELRKRGIKFANTTGYDTFMMGDLMKLAKDGGYEPEFWVCPDMVGKGRPAPWMAFYAAQKLDVYPMSNFVKVGDTLVDIAEAKNAGMWSVSLTRTGNEVGLSQAELEAMSPSEQQARIDAAHKKLATLSPNYVIEGVAHLMPVIDEINQRLARGEKP